MKSFFASLGGALLAAGLMGSVRRVEKRSDTAAASDGYDLALDEARRALDHQGEAASTLRGRVTSVVSVGALAAAFIGGLIARDVELSTSAWTWVAISAFIALLGIALACLWPVKLVFNMRSDVIVGWVDLNATTPEMKRDLALHMWRHYRDNDVYARRWTRLYRWALVLLAVEVAALLLDLGGR